jgi:hypothetical protein
VLSFGDFPTAPPPPADDGDPPAAAIAAFVVSDPAPLLGGPHGARGSGIASAVPASSSETSAADRTATPEVGGSSAGSTTLTSSVLGGRLASALQSTHHDALDQVFTEGLSEVF